MPSIVDVPESIKEQTDDQLTLNHRKVHALWRSLDAGGALDDGKAGELVSLHSFLAAELETRGRRHEEMSDGLDQAGVVNFQVMRSDTDSVTTTTAASGWNTVALNDEPKPKGFWAKVKRQLGRLAKQELPEDEKFTKQEVNYRDAEGTERCGTCVFFIGDRAACEIVAGRIEADDLCDEYEAVSADLISRARYTPASKQAEKRFTFGPVYIPSDDGSITDAHGEFIGAEELQETMWDFIRTGQRDIHLQHSEHIAGEMVEMAVWPFEFTVKLTTGEEFTFPAGTPFMGVVWTPEAWELVKSDAVTGYSIGGFARREEQ